MKPLTSHPLADGETVSLGRKLTAMTAPMGPVARDVLLRGLSEGAADLRGLLDMRNALPCVESGVLH